jgi:2-octaprenylphenol hydroxylase
MSQPQASTSEPVQTASSLTFDVVIVGAGLVGATMACALAGSDHCKNLSVAIIEAYAPASPAEEYDPRVVALTQASQQLLNSVGVWNDVVMKRACAYTNMDVWDADGTGQIQFDCRDVQQNYLGHIVENSVITQLLWERLQELPQITLLHPAALTELHNNSDGSCHITLEDGRLITSQLLVAADGANSKIRQLLGIETREWDYGHNAIVTTVKTQNPHQFTAWQRFLSTGPLAFLPLQRDANAHREEFYSSIVWSAESDYANHLMTLTDSEFMACLGEAFEYKLGPVTEVAKRYSFPLRQRHAIDYIQAGVVLIGDAAHTIHPLAGQGVNLGFLDVQALFTEIERACERDLPLTEPSILRRYQRNRKSDNLGMMSVMEGFKALFAGNDLPVRWLRNEGMRRLNNISLLKSAIIKQAMGL